MRGLPVVLACVGAARVSAISLVNEHAQAKNGPPEGVTSLPLEYIPRDWTERYRRRLKNSVFLEILRW